MLAFHIQLRNNNTAFAAVSSDVYMIGALFLHFKYYFVFYMLWYDGVRPVTMVSRCRLAIFNFQYFTFAASMRCNCIINNHQIYGLGQQDYGHICALICSIGLHLGY